MQEEKKIGYRQKALERFFGRENVEEQPAIQLFLKQRYEPKPTDNGNFNGDDAA